MHEAAEDLRFCPGCRVYRLRSDVRVIANRKGFRGRQLRFYRCVRCLQFRKKPEVPSQ